MTRISESASAAEETSSDVDFLIVGTPRSGTTLIQRLACELPGVCMPPETHFFGFFALDLLSRTSFPIGGADLRHQIEAFAAHPKSLELNLDVSAVYEALAGRCANITQMFSAVVRVLAGPAAMYGEKSPEHLLWWRPLSESLPDLNVVSVVRDPRAVIASSLAVWPPRSRSGPNSHVLRAERWAADQREVRLAQDQLGAERCLVLRYEDVVRDPDAARAKLGEFLRVPIAAEAAVAGSAGNFAHIVLPHESHKKRVFGAISSDRVEAWRDSLSETESEEIARICGAEMERFGYRRSNGNDNIVGRTRWAPSVWGNRLRFRVGRRRHLARINRIKL